MLRTLEMLKDEIFKGYEVLDFKSGNGFYFLKIEAASTGVGCLFLRQ